MKNKKAKGKEKSIEQKFHDFMMDSRGFISIEEARKELNKRWPKKLEMIDKILSKSKLTEKDALEIGRKVNRGIAKRHIIKK